MSIARLASSSVIPCCESGDTIRNAVIPCEGGASSSSTTYRKQSVSVCVRVSFARYRAISSHRTVCHPKSVVFSRCEMNDEKGGPYDANDSRRCDTDCGEHRHVEESIILMSGTAVRIVDRGRSVWVGIWV